MPLEDRLARLTFRSIQRGDPHTEGHPVAVARRRHGGRKPQRDGRRLRQRQGILDPSRPCLAFEPRRMDCQHVTRDVAEPLRVLEVDRTPISFGRSRPAHRHRLGRLAEDCHHGATHGNLQESQRAISGQWQRFPGERRCGPGPCRQLRLQDQNRMGCARLTLPGERGVGVDGIMGGIRALGHRHAKAAAGLGLGRRRERHRVRRFAPPAVD